MLCLKKRQRRPASLKSSVRCFHFLISSCLLAFPPRLLQIQIKTRSPKTREENKPRRLPAVWRGRCFADADGSICWQIIGGHVVRRTDAAAASVQTGSPGDRMRKDQSSVSWFWSHLTAKAGLLSCLLCKSRHPHSIWSYNKDKNRISMLQNDHIYCVMADIHCRTCRCERAFLHCGVTDVVKDVSTSSTLSSPDVKLCSVIRQLKDHMLFDSKAERSGCTLSVTVLWYYLYVCCRGFFRCILYPVFFTGVLSLHTCSSPPRLFSLYLSPVFCSVVIESSALF